MSSRNHLADLAVSDSGFVFDPRSGATFSLNPTGLAALLALREGLSADAVAARLRDRFDGGESAREDVLDFVQSLRQHGLVPPDFQARLPTRCPARDHPGDTLAMKNRPLTIAVTGLNATDNPAPGVGVIRSLREAGGDDDLVGLAYDALDPGVYAKDIVSDVFLLPYPSSSLDAFSARLEHVRESAGLDVIIPTLDAELPAFLALEQRLRAMGVGLLLPTREQLDLRSKANLPELGRRASLDVPATAVVTSLRELAEVHEKIAYPFWVKGVFYGAQLAHTHEEAVAAFHKAASQWGLPIIIQAGVSGEELNVVGLGDGKGGLWGAVPMKKLLITDKGKGWAGITIHDPDLMAMAERFVKATGWRGPFEVEAIRDRDGRYHLLEINPRFPAWVYLSAAAGVNLPRACADLAVGRSPKRERDYDVGTMFVRISVDQVASLSDLERILTAGEVRRAPARGVAALARKFPGGTTP